MRLVAALLLLAVAAPGDDSNLLPNGGFEGGEDGWIFFQFGGNDAREIDPKAKGGGKGALHVTKAAKSGNPAMIWTDYALAPGQEGTLSFSIRAKGKKLGRTQVLFIVWDANGESAA